MLVFGNALSGGSNTGVKNSDELLGFVEERIEEGRFLD